MYMLLNNLVYRRCRLSTGCLLAINIDAVVSLEILHSGVLFAGNLFWCQLVGHIIADNGKGPQGLQLLLYMVAD
jgi:hypothetical protein